MNLRGPLGTIPMSPTMAVVARAAALRANGADIASLAAGEPAFDTPTVCVEAMHKAAAKGATRYPALLGLPSLREAVAATFSVRYGVAFNPNEIAITEGGKQAIFAALQALVGTGDEVLLPAPYWVSYAGQLQLIGGRGVAVPMVAGPERWSIDVAALEAAVSPRTTGIILNSPHNPTGWTISAAEARAIARFVDKHDLWVLCDDVYVGLELDGGPRRTLLALEPQLRSRVLIVDSVSKRYAMTGWRVGFLAAPLALIGAVGTWLSQTNSGIAPFVQHGALAALRTFGDAMPDGWCSHYRTNRDVMLQHLGSRGWHTLTPEGAFYVLARPPGAMVDDMALATRLLEDHGVATVPGSAFAWPGHLRLSFACSTAELERGLVRLTR